MDGSRGLETKQAARCSTCNTLVGLCGNHALLRRDPHPSPDGTRRGSQENPRSHLVSFETLTPTSSEGPGKCSQKERRNEEQIGLF